MLTCPPTLPPGATALLTDAKSVVIVPGFGMAVANAQHMVASLVKELEKGGAKVGGEGIGRGGREGGREGANTQSTGWVASLTMKELEKGGAKV